jgi:hypothetical protein
VTVGKPWIGRTSKPRETEALMSKWIAIGIAIGVAIGAMYENVGVGVALGIALGSIDKHRTR